MEKAYCYRKLWRKPITIHKLGKGDMALAFSKGLEVRQIIVALLIFAFFLLFRKQINLIVGGMWRTAFYALIPWLVAGWLVKKNVDGKRLDRYILGSLSFFYNRRFSYSSFKPVYDPQMERPQSYEKFEVIIDD